MQFAKLFLAALVFALGVVACSGGGSSSSGGGGDSAGIVPTTFDLSVTTFSVSSSSIVAGDAITFAATVTNDSSANVSSSVAALKYYRSTDTTIDSTADTEVGTADSISALAPAATESKTAIVNPSTAGTFYYFACVVATDDRDTSNDCSAGVQVDVAAQDFDLSVTAFSVAPSSIVAGEAITFSATVTNDSSATVSSSVAALKYYRSTDATIDSTADTEVGTAASISALAAAATESETAIVNPSTAGTFYYGACVVATGDSDTSNDCSTGVQVDVAAQEFDLSVTTFSVSDSSVPTNEPITFTATVTNDSSATKSSPVATLKYYRSSDATIDATDTEVSTAGSIGALAAAATETETASVTVPSTTGTYYYGACVVAAGDSDTSNDCSTGVQVDVVAQEFDLSVTASVSTSFAVLGSFGFIDQSITLTATVTNDASATVSSPVAELKYYRSTDATIDATDTEVGVADSIGALAAAATETETATDSVPAVVGTYYYGACVVGAGDSDTSNDCSAGVQVDVVAREFDVSVTTFSVSDSSVPTNERIRLAVTLRNDSLLVDAEIHTLTFYRSSDATITSADTEVGVSNYHSLFHLPFGYQDDSFIHLDSPSTAGTYYYGACVEAYSAHGSQSDTDTSNNCSAGVQVVVVARDFDLSVTTFSVSDSSVLTNEPITFTATVGNASSAMHPSLVATLKYYRSTDATIDSTTDTEVGTADSISALAAAATESETVSVTVPSTTGTYYYGACVVAVGDSDTSNDCSAGVQVDVTDSGFDLSVTAFAVNDSSIRLDSDDSFIYGATVTNASSATTSSPAATVRFYRSFDATIETTDAEVGTDSIGALAPGGTAEARDTDPPHPAAAGAYYYGACVVSIGDSAASNDCWRDGVQVLFSDQ